MKMDIVDVTIPENLIPYLYTIKDGKDINEKLLISTVIGLFLSKAITLEKAAELTNKSIWDFIDILRAQQIPWGEYSEDDFQMDDLTLHKLSEDFYE